MTAAVFDEAGIDLLLVGDSLANVVLGRETTLSLTMEEMIPLTRAVVEATSRSFVVVDLPLVPMRNPRRRRCARRCAC